MSFTYQRSCCFKLDNCPFHESEYPEFFDVEFDRTVNPSNNIWNILQFSSTYVSDFTANISSKYINNLIFTNERALEWRMKITSVLKNSN